MMNAIIIQMKHFDVKAIIALQLVEKLHGNVTIGQLKVQVLLCYCNFLRY